MKKSIQSKSSILEPQIDQIKQKIKIKKSNKKNNNKKKVIYKKKTYSNKTKENSLRITQSQKIILRWTRQQIIKTLAFYSVHSFLLNYQQLSLNSIQQINSYQFNILKCFSWQDEILFQKYRYNDKNYPRLLAILLKKFLGTEKSLQQCLSKINVLRKKIQQSQKKCKIQQYKRFLLIKDFQFKIYLLRAKQFIFDTFLSQIENNSTYFFPLNFKVNKPQWITNKENYNPIYRQFKIDFDLKKIKKFQQSQDERKFYNQSESLKQSQIPQKTKYKRNQDNKQDQKQIIPYKLKIKHKIIKEKYFKEQFQNDNNQMGISCFDSLSFKTKQKIRLN